MRYHGNNIYPDEQTNAHGQPENIMPWMTLSGDKA